MSGAREHTEREQLVEMEYLGEEGQGEGPAGHPGAGTRLWQVRGGGSGRRGYAGEGRENINA